MASLHSAIIAVSFGWDKPEKDFQEIVLSAPRCNNHFSYTWQNSWRKTYSFYFISPTHTFLFITHVHPHALASAQYCTMLWKEYKSAKQTEPSTFTHFKLYTEYFRFLSHPGYCSVFWLWCLEPLLEKRGTSTHTHVHRVDETLLIFFGRSSSSAAVLISSHSN